MGLELYIVSVRFLLSTQLHFLPGCCLPLLRCQRVLYCLPLLGCWRVLYCQLMIRPFVLLRVCIWCMHGVTILAIPMHIDGADAKSWIFFWSYLCSYDVLAHANFWSALLASYTSFSCTGLNNNLHKFNNLTLANWLDRGSKRLYCWSQSGLLAHGSSSFSLLLVSLYYTLKIARALKSNIIEKNWSSKNDYAPVHSEITIQFPTQLMPHWFLCKFSWHRTTLLSIEHLLRALPHSPALVVANHQHCDATYVWTRSSIRWSSRSIEITALFWTPIMT